VSNSFPIVGVKFRPPALGLLSVLPSQCPLVARREPSNAYDANAIMVLVATRELEKLDPNALEEAVVGYGSSWVELHKQPEWHLGYIPRTDVAALAPQMDAKGTPQLKGELAFSAIGIPRINLEEI
jgi:HIRAN domain